MLEHPSGLLDALVALFEAVWRDAVDVAPGLEQVDEGRLPEELTELDGRIVTLLLAGLTDVVIAPRVQMKSSCAPSVISMKSEALMLASTSS